MSQIVSRLCDTGERPYDCEREGVRPGEPSVLAIANALAPERRPRRTAIKTKGNTVLQEFKDFIDKGGVFEAAVGLVMALAFIPVVDSIVDHIVLPIVAAIIGKPNFNMEGGPQ